MGQGVYLADLESGARRALARRGAWRVFRLLCRSTACRHPQLPTPLVGIVVYQARKHRWDRLPRARTANILRASDGTVTARLPQRSRADCQQGPDCQARQSISTP